MNNLMSVHLLDQEIYRVQKAENASEDLWRDLLKSAAGKAGAALATYLSGPGAAVAGDQIGQAIFGMMFPSGPTAEQLFQKEVIERLDRIEHEIINLVRFVEEKLPTLIKQQVDKAFAESVVAKIGSLQTTVRGQLRALARNNPSKEDVDGLMVAGKDVLQLGTELTYYGQEWHGAVISAFVTGLTICGRLAARNLTYRSIFINHVLNYQRYATACLSEEPSDLWPGSKPSESYGMLRARIQRERVWASQVLEGILKNRSSYLLGIGSMLLPTGYFNGGDPFNLPTFEMQTVAVGGWWEVQGPGPSFNGNRLGPVVLSGAPDQPLTEELIARALAIPPANHYVWVRPLHRPVVDLRAEPQRNLYDEMTAEIWQADGMQKFGAVAGPSVNEAVGVILLFKESLDVILKESGAVAI